MESPKFPYHRIVIIGTTGSGKSTLAEQLATTLELDFIELDALHWLPGWNHRSSDAFRALVDEASRAPSWAMAGNYSIARDISWPRAEAVIWLDYRLWTVFWRLTFRTFRRWWAHELLWGTNYENLMGHFKLWSDESLWHWQFKTYWRRKREYPLLFARPEYAHLKILRFSTPKELDEWMKNLGC